MRQLREARSAAEQLENFLARKGAEDRYMTSLSPAARQAADAAARQQRREQLARQMVQEGFTGRAAPGELLRYYPASYSPLREAAERLAAERAQP